MVVLVPLETLLDPLDKVVPIRREPVTRQDSMIGELPDLPRISRLDAVPL